MMTRRNFAKVIGASTASFFTTNITTGQIREANDRIQLGFIGIGNQGKSLLGGFLQKSEVQVTAVCDVAQPMLERALNICRAAGHEARAYHDFRDLLRSPKIDAVAIATPDHWHPYMTIEACKQGKDVYVEKPISTDVYSGQKMVEAARKYNRVVQVGTQQRSAEYFQNAAHLFRSGLLGKVTSADTFINSGGLDLFSSIGIASEIDPPEWLDWELWLGPVASPAECPFTMNRFGVLLDQNGMPAFNEHGDLKRWSTFRITACPGNLWLATGIVGDWGVHLLDILRWAFQVKGPVNVSAQGGVYCIKGDDRATPDTITVTYDMGPVVESIWHFRHRSCGISKSFRGKLDGRGREHGIIFVGSAATLELNREGYQIIPEPGKDIGSLTVRDGENYELADSGRERRLQIKSSGARVPFEHMRQNNEDGGGSAHLQNFLNCLRTRQRPISDIEEGHRSTIMCLLGNASYMVKEMVDWNPAIEETNNSAVIPILFRPERPEWRLVV